MKSSSISDIKKVLQTLEKNDIEALCLKLAKFKKENKELLHYLLFEEADEQHFIKETKAEIDTQFAEISVRNAYLLKKSIRKILKNVNKHIKIANSKTIEIELLIHFCHHLKSSHFLVQSSVLENIFHTQFKKIEKGISTLHEDLQYDYRMLIEKLLLVSDNK